MVGTLRIVGIGSPHGDDRIGWYLAEEVAATRSGRGAVAVSHPLDLFNLELDSDCGLVLIDACRTGGPPAAVIELDWPWNADNAPDRSTHGYGLTAALALAVTLRRLPRAVHLFGIEAADDAPRTGFSPALTRALPDLTRRLHNRLDEWGRSLTMVT